jgi:hypothetical protein
MTADEKLLKNEYDCNFFPFFSQFAEVMGYLHHK